MGVQRRNVPHFKALINAKVDLEAQGRYTTFTLHHALWKKAILHLKRPRVQELMSPIVSNSSILETFGVVGLSKNANFHYSLKDA